MSATNLSFNRLTSYAGRYPKQLVISIILVIALIAFEIFNFDTTQYALANLLGNVAFAGLAWATILAIAFCGIDLAGLVRLFTPQSGGDEPKEVWYLMGAWLLGATMNAVMTWWAVSLTLLNHDFGNEVLSREQLLRYVPIFVAVLVWLTRILFIGSISIAGEHLLGQSSPGGGSGRRSSTPSRNPLKSGRRSNGRKVAPQRAAPQQAVPQRAAPPAKASPRPVTNPPKVNGVAQTSQPAIAQQPPLPVAKTPPPPPATPQRKPINSRPPVKSSRVRQRPPRPGLRPAAINSNPGTSPRVNG